MAQGIRDDDGVSNPSHNPSLTDVVERAIAANPSRRRLLMGGLGAAALPFLGGLAACGGDDGPEPERMFGFSAVATSTADTVVVPTGYVATAFLPWGEPINTFGPGLEGRRQQHRRRPGAASRGQPRRHPLLRLRRRRQRPGRAQRRGAAGDEPRVHQPRVLLRPRQ
jgi:hypothetical protein